MVQFSRRTNSELVSLLTGWTLAEIARLFEDEGIAMGTMPNEDSDSSIRRRTARGYLSSLDDSSNADFAKLCEVYSTMLLWCADGNPWSVSAGEKLAETLRRDGFTVDSRWRISSELISFSPEALSSLKDAAAIHEHLRRLNDIVETDPRLAISVARDLVESAAKLILTEIEIPYSPSADLPELTKAAALALGLHASVIDASTSDAQASLRKMLGALNVLAQTLTELRNQVGVGHGRESVPLWVKPRHARLVAGAASIWCQMVLETLKDPNAPWRVRVDTTPSGDTESKAVVI